jgi:hypothetical protein
MYWQHGDRYYVLQGSGVDDAEMIMVAESIR